MEFILSLLEIIGVIIGISVVVGVLIYFFMSLSGNVKQYKPPVGRKNPLNYNQIKEVSGIIQSKKMNKEETVLEFEENKKNTYLSSSELELIKTILIKLDNDINDKQGWAPDQWWFIVKNRAQSMKTQAKKMSSDIKTIQFLWTLDHCAEYEKRQDWKTFEDKRDEIGFRIERYSEIIFFLEKAHQQIISTNDNTKLCVEDSILASKIKIDFNSFVTIEDLNWCLASALASLFSCYLYAKRTGLSHDEIKDLIIVDLDYDNNEVDSLFKRYKEINNDMQKEADNSQNFKKDDKQNIYQPFTRHHSNGNKKSTGYLNSDGKLEGNCKEYYENGNIFKDGNYKNGIPDGNQKEYFENGDLKLDFNYEDGVQHGIQKEFYEGGNPNIIAHYNLGNLHGLREQYYPSGKIETRNTYDDGMMEGVHIYLKEDGVVIEEKIMQKGLDITMELMGLMTENNSEHMLKADAIKGSRMQPGEFFQKIYDYYKSKNLRVESAQVSALNQLYKEGKIAKEFYDTSMIALGQVKKSDE